MHELAPHGVDYSGCMTAKIFKTALHSRLDVPKKIRGKDSVHVCREWTSEYTIPVELFYRESYNFGFLRLSFLCSFAGLEREKISFKVCFSSTESWVIFISKFLQNKRSSPLI